MQQLLPPRNVAQRQFPSPSVVGEPLLANEPYGVERPLAWLVMRRWKKTILAAAILGLLLGGAATKLQTPRYRAHATLEIEDLNDNFLNTKQVIPVNDGTTSNVFSDVQTQIQLLQSNVVLERVSAALSNGKTGPRGTERPAYSSQEVLQVRRSLAVRAVGQTRIIELTSESSNPTLAAAFLNQLCTQVIDRNVSSRLEASQNIGEWLTKLVQGAQETLRSSEAALQKYARSHGLIFTQENKSIAEESFRQLQDELARVKALRIDRQSQFETIQSSSVLTPSALRDSSLQKYEQNLDDLRKSRAELAAVYTQDYTKIKQLDAQIESVQAALRREQRNIFDRVQSEYEQADRRQSLLADEFSRQAERMSDIGQRSIEYSILQHEVDSNRQLYDSMLQRVKEATIASAVQPSKIRVVDHASRPTSPIYPKPLLNCASGLVLFSFGSLLFAFGRERFDSTLKDPGDATVCLQMPELGAIPHVSRERSPALQSGSRRESTGVKSLLSADTLSDQKSSPVVKQNQLIADSFSSIATSVLFSGADSLRTHVVVVTSAGPHEGKTTVVTNLGNAFARSRRRVLLIDGDLRCKRLSQVLGANNEIGLGTILTSDSQISIDDLPPEFIQATPEDRLYLLASGPTGPYSPDLLHSAQLPPLLQKLRKDFDVILIDTPPLLDMPDARLLARFADGVLFVTRSRRTTVAAAFAALQRLKLDNTRLLGIVLNDWNTKESASGYYGVYGYNGYDSRSSKSHLS
jgi:polysaccharide biosynthesis transport protein